MGVVMLAGSTPMMKFWDASRFPTSVATSMLLMGTMLATELLTLSCFSRKQELSWLMQKKTAELNFIYM
jgi:hypothetical protein